MNLFTTVESEIKKSKSIPNNYKTITNFEKAKELVLVEWVDIISDDGWVIAEDCHLPTFYTVGWLEYQDDKVLKICNTLDFDDFTEEHKKKEKRLL